jgi:hypothetical protein
MKWKIVKHLRTVSAAIVLAAFTALAATGSVSRADATITCYYGVNPPASNCGFKSFGNGALATGEIDRPTTTGEAMYNQTAGTSKRVRVVDSANNNVAGWWSSSAQNFLVSWSARAWVRGQCNNQTTSIVMVNCGFQW